MTERIMMALNVDFGFLTVFKRICLSLVDETDRLWNESSGRIKYDVFFLKLFDKELELNIYIFHEFTF